MTAAARFGPIGLFVVALAASIPHSASAIQAPTANAGWRPLFDGKSLTNWQSTKFGGEGTVKVEDGQIILETGKTLTGITWAGGQLPTTNYEIAMQGMRVAGHDFFAGITFPVGDSFCSLILGGWGGSVVGLSSINFLDASENETSQSIDFENGRWYNIRIRVTPEKIQAWLDDRQIIDQALKDNKISVRIEVEASEPLGIATWKTTGAVRNIRIRTL